MRLRHLAMALSKLPPHPQLSVELEQYPTEGDFAARWIAEMVLLGDLDGETRVTDLGAGNGILGIGCLLAGVASVELVEIDSNCIHDHYAERVKWSNHDVSEWKGTEVDLIVMNPPWGVQTTQADRVFLEKAFSSSAKVVYCLHNAHAKHVAAIAKDKGWKSDIVLKGEFKLPPKYEHHASNSATTKVVVWRFCLD
jgi:putative methylase